MEWKKIVRHPQHHIATNDYDVVIVHLSDRFNNDSTAAVIELASEVPKDGSLVTTTGWGVMNPSIPKPAEHLQQAEHLEVMGQKGVQGKLDYWFDVSNH